jgi:hypothetical protein
MKLKGANHSFRTPESLAWISFERGNAMSPHWPLTPSLSPSDGEGVPFRAGEGSMRAHGISTGSGCLSLGHSQLQPWPKLWFDTFPGV